MSEDVPQTAVVVIGAGIGGIACARALHEAGHEVVVLERARVVGGRMARWTRDGRAVDIGAAYFTVRDPDFAAVAESWATRGLAHPWTDTFAVLGADARLRPAPGPVRWSAEGGLRSLVADLADGLDVRLQHEVSQVGLLDGRPAVDGGAVRAVVLAMPDPQARDLLGDDLAVVAERLESQWQPVVSVAMAFEQRTWRGLDAVFVHDTPVSLVVDDGRRRGDGAPVLVAHSTHAAARAHLDDPSGFESIALEQVRRVLAHLDEPADCGEPVWIEAKRWGSAEPLRPRTESYLLADVDVAVCGDGWSGRPRVEAAWTSGRDAGRALASRLR